MWTGEVAAVVSFWICFFVCRKWLSSTQMIISITYPLVILSIILLQGALFWWILLKRLSVSNFAKNTGSMFGKMKYLDIILISIGVPIVIFHYTSKIALLISIFILVFAILEWINYYKIRLSYSYNSWVLIKRITHGKWKTSKLAKEIYAYNKGK